MFKHKRGLYLGRFQPVHNGHVYAVNYILKECEELIIAVMASQYSFTFENPFTAGERIEMLRLTFKNQWHRLFVIPILNIPFNSPWIHYIRNLAPDFEVIYSNHYLVKLLAEKEGFEVKDIPYKQRNILKATQIREMMAKGDREWENFVPEEVVNYIKKINGVYRLKTILERRD